jgi:hypothetical protein
MCRPASGLLTGTCQSLRWIVGLFGLGFAVHLWLVRG